MFIVIALLLHLRSSGAQCICAAATSGSAGAVIILLECGYKHLVPPGPNQCFEHHQALTRQNRKLEARAIVLTFLSNPERMR